MFKKAKSLKYLSSTLKEKYKLELRNSLSKKDKNNFLRIDYKALTNI